MIKSYDGEKYITLTRQSLLNESNIVVTRQDKDRYKKEFQIVMLPADGVEKVTQYRCCTKCRSSVIEDNRVLVKCCICGRGQLKSKGRRCSIAEIMREDSDITITVFDEQLREIYALKIKIKIPPKR